jgi:hypothetical protein
MKPPPSRRIRSPWSLDGYISLLFQGWALALSEEDCSSFNEGRMFSLAGMTSSGLLCFFLHPVD